MRVVSIVLGLSLLVACSSNNDLASDATGGYPSFGTGGFGAGSGGFVSSGGSGTSNGGTTISSGGFGTGGFGTGGANGGGGSPLDASVDATATADAAADGATGPDVAAPDSGVAPTACADLLP